MSASHHNVQRVPVVLPPSKSFTFKIMAVALDDTLISGFRMILSSKLLSVLWDDTAEKLLPEDFGSNFACHMNCQGDSLYLKRCTYTPQVPLQPRPKQRPSTISAIRVRGILCVSLRP